MRSVLIIGPNYYNFLPAVAEAFRTLGWKTAVEGYDMPVHPYSGLMRVRYKLRRDRQRMPRTGLILRSGSIPSVPISCLSSTATCWKALRLTISAAKPR